MSKILESLTNSQLCIFLGDNNDLQSQQSAHRTITNLFIELKAFVTVDDSIFLLSCFKWVLVKFRLLLEIV